MAGLGLAAGATNASARPKADPVPAELLASVAMGPATTLRGLQAYAEAIKPGAGASITDQVVRGGIAELVGASSLDGFDATSWTYVLVASGDAAPRFALLGKVSDATTLATSAGAAHVLVKGGWAVVGARPLLERIGPYALASIATQPAPAALNATVYLAHVRARYQAELAAFRNQMLASMASAAATTSGGMGKLMTAYVDGLGTVVSDADQVVVTLDVTEDLASLDVALTPGPGSRLARFVALQRPSDYALLGKLPPGSPTMLAAGHFEAGPYRDGVLEALVTLYGPAASGDLLAAMNLFRTSLTGEFGITMQMAPGAGMALTQVLGLSNPRAAEQAIVAMLDLFKDGRSFDMLGISTTIKADPAAAAHDGVTLHGYETTYDLSRLPPAQRKAMAAAMPRDHAHAQLATFDGLAMLVMDADGAIAVGHAIDGARGKAASFVAAPPVDGLLAASRARKESVAMTMDLGLLMARVTGRPASGPQPVMMALGFADRRAHLRFAMAAATLRAAVNAGKP